jgi:hypothetical protein
LPGAGADVDALVVSRDARHWMSSSGRGWVLWDADGRQRRLIARHGGNCALEMPDGSAVLLVTGGTLILCSWTGELLGVWVSWASYHSQLAWGPNGQLWWSDRIGESNDFGLWRADWQHMHQAMLSRVSRRHA